MQKNHLFATVLVSLSVALISFSAPASNGSVPSMKKVESVAVATPAATCAAAKGYASLYEGLSL